MRRPWLPWVLLVAVGCGDSDDDPGVDAGSPTDLRQADASPPDLVGLPDADPQTDAGGGMDAAGMADAAIIDGGGGMDAGMTDGGVAAGDPPAGDPELTLFAAQDEIDPSIGSQQEVRQLDLLYWECGIQAEGIGHIWASFRLDTDFVNGLTPAQQAELESNVEMVLIDRFDTVVARNEPIIGILDFTVAGRVQFIPEVPGARMVLDRNVVGGNTRPSDLDEDVELFEVRLTIPGGPTFTRTARVETLVPASQPGC